MKKIKRKSSETDIKIAINLEGVGRSDINSPIEFLNHLLDAFTRHGSFDLSLVAEGDTEIDQHHTIEDIGIVLGQAVKVNLKEMKGLKRSGFFAFPMDESLSLVAIDISGRARSEYRCKFKRRWSGDMDLDLIPEFFCGFCDGLGANVAVYVPYGENDHHKAEAIFKAFGKALQMATTKTNNKDYVPSTKDLIDLK